MRDMRWRGSVRRAENRLRVTVQLLETAAGTHVWANDYDRSKTTADISQSSRRWRIRWLQTSLVPRARSLGLDKRPAARSRRRVWQPTNAYLRRNPMTASSVRGSMRKRVTAWSGL